MILNMKFFTLTTKLALSLLLLIHLQGYAQEPNFSMYHYTPFFTNPGQLGTLEDVRLMLNYRNQAVEIGDNFSSSSLSAFYPMNIGNHRLVIAGNFLNDQLSDFVTTNGGLLGVAYSISLSARSALSLGLQGGYFRRSTESDFVTDDQFVDGGFDPNAVSGDAVLNQDTNYPTLSGGLFYQLDDGRGAEKAFIGASIFNAIEPNVSLTDERDDNLPLSIRTTAGYRVYEGTNLSVMPTLRWVNQSGNDFFNVGSRFGYALSETGDRSRKVELGLWYNTNDLGVFSIAYEQSNITVGASYDLPIGNDLSTGQNGIFELAVSFRLKKKPKKTYQDPSQDTKTSINTGPGATEPSEEEVAGIRGEEQVEPIEEQSTTQEEPSRKEGDSAPVPKTGITEEEPAKPVEPIDGQSTTDAGPVRQEEIPVPARKAGLTGEERKVLEKTVKFTFNTYELDKASQLFLDQVGGILTQYPELKVELIGHSCNIGPENINLELSLQRAEAVMQYLASKGVSKNTFILKGRGEEMPLEANTTVEGRRHNRRVEFSVLN